MRKKEGENVMTIPLWCLLAGVVMPYLWAGASVPLRVKEFGNADLATPRVQAEQLTAGGHGAWGAQLNAWEALIVFAVANLVAFMAGLNPEGAWATAAIVWVVARFFHGVFYIANVPPARIACFVGGLGSSLYIFFLAAGV